MRAKFITVTLLALLLGLVMLDLRQQRIDAMHEMTRLHGGMNVSRKEIWKQQAKIAEMSHPENLQEAIDRIGLDLEPITPVAAPSRLNRP